MRFKVTAVFLCMLAVFAAPGSQLDAQDIREVTLRSLSKAVIGSYGTDGSYYVGQYGFQVGSSPGSPLWDFVCVDFARSVGMNQSFDARFTSLASGDLGDTYLGSRGAAFAQQRYLMSAYLIEKIQTADADEIPTIHAAIWQITGTDLGAGYGYTVQGDGGTSLTESYLAEAGANWQTVNGEYWRVVSDVNGNRQEFMTYVTPEPTSMLLLGTGMAGLAWFRRRNEDEEVEEEQDLA